jgi:hypothetical protein
MRLFDYPLFGSNGQSSQSRWCGDAVLARPHGQTGPNPSIGLGQAGAEAGRGAVPRGEDFVLKSKLDVLTALPGDPA